jgi:ribosome biogenesis GTPase A
MDIQWFPGHMAAARKGIAQSLAHIDLVIELCDARIPGTSRNPLLQALRLARQRPVLLLLNKSDLADPRSTQLWLAHWSAQPGLSALAVSCRKPGGSARIIAACKRLAPHRNTPDKPLRIMIAGIPNVGKSTLINILAQQRLARVGDEPAITKSQQRIDLSSQISLLDTPGLLWPKIDHPEDGWRLAATRAIGILAVPEREVALALIGYVHRTYPKTLSDRYAIDPQFSGGCEDILDHIARYRGCLLRGGILDTLKAARLVLDDFRTGTLGRISLETPTSLSTRIPVAQTPDEDIVQRPL